MSADTLAAALGAAQHIVTTAKAVRRPGMSQSQLAAALERLDREIEQGTYQPSRTPDRYALMAGDLFRWSGL
ncbi:MAG: hypothetical protein AAFP79_05110 [Pseudomonadota bacterium]